MQLTKSIIYLLLFFNLLNVSACLKLKRNIGENMMQLNSVELALKQLLDKEKSKIQKDAFFVYEEDPFNGVRRLINENKWVLGKWIITFSNESCLATIRKDYGMTSEHWDAEIIEVVLIKKEGGYQVKEWKAYQEWGN